MAKSPAQRKREQRARDKLKEEQRLAALLAYRLQVDVFHATAEHLERIMTTCEIEERQDVVSRLIHNVSRMPDDQIRELLSQP